MVDSIGSASDLGLVIYLDANATTPVDEEVVEAMLPFLREHCANPSAMYAEGRLVKKAVDRARGQLAELLGADADEIVFTSGATESNNAAIESARVLYPDKPLLVTTAVEHSAVLEPARRWEALGGRVVRVGVEPNGELDLVAFEQALEPGRTALVSVMWVNNETGVEFPVAELAARAHAAGALFHTDAAQAVGKVAMQLRETEIDYLSLTGHKFHAPKGIGALYSSRRVRFRPWILGGGQEGGRRSGTENVPYVVGLGAAAERMRKHLQEGGGVEVAALRDEFESGLKHQIPDVCVHGEGNARLGTTSSVCFQGVDSAGLLILLDEAGVCCSAGSACHEGSSETSHVLAAMGVAEKDARSTLRFSFSRMSTRADAVEAVAIVSAAVGKMRRLRSDIDGPVVLG